MSKRIVIGVVSGAMLAVLSLAAQGQAAAPPKSGTIGLYRNQLLAPPGPAPKLADGTPDLSGVWLGGGGSDADIANPRALKPGDQVVMLPWAEEIVKHRLSKEDPEANCLPAVFLADRRIRGGSCKLLPITSFFSKATSIAIDRSS